MTKNIPKVITIILTVFIMAVMFGFQANAASELNNNSSLSSSRIALGNAVTINASASGGEGGYTYQYSYAAPGTSTFVTLKSYSSVNSYSFSPTIAGTYTIRVAVKSGSTVKNKDITLNVVKVTNTSTINTASVTVGQSVFWVLQRAAQAHTLINIPIRTHQEQQNTYQAATTSVHLLSTLNRHKQVLIQSMLLQKIRTAL